MEAPQTESTPLDLSRLHSQERKQQLYTILKSFPAHIGWKERMHLTAAQTGIAVKLLYQTARRSGWQARLAADVAAEQELAEYNARLDAAAPPQPDIPATRIASSVKGLVWTLLAASRRYVDTCCQMLTYYSDRIALRIAQAGGLAALDAQAAKEIGELQAKLGYYAKQLQPYMTPGPISTLLATIDFTSRLPATDEAVETTHFTVAALQAKLLELGMSSGPAFADPSAATVGLATEPLPLLNGWANAQQNSPLHFFDESQPDNL